ncbi:helix-turn-helix domain-containing protein [Mobiluncus curtisii]|uniref:HTH cro/C1-type domain-containing protein n=4 Tax=Mobiluncus curtisii TaxID=2051 RepID=D6ZG31_MOBCV|nr:hypothetical protein HMPREF0573_11270 [Mobiluncus curtisii ATCC 43063]SQB65079.1 Predicted transcriptional regulator [Mobiluncus curtisii]
MKIQYSKLWKILIDKNMNKVQLREAAGISSNSLAKLGKNEPVRMDVLMKIAPHSTAKSKTSSRPKQTHRTKPMLPKARTNQPTSRPTDLIELIGLRIRLPFLTTSPHAKRQYVSFS